MLLSPPDDRAAPDTLPAPVRRTAHAPQVAQLLVVTDAWHPQVNGVVQTWTYMQRELAQLGVAARYVTPAGPSLPVPGEPGLRLTLRPGAQLQRALQTLRGELQSHEHFALHIATEGPLGWAARRWARAQGLAFTTSYHTRFPEYFERRFGLPARLTYPTFRRFHAASSAVLVPTQRMVEALAAQRFERVRLWPRGVDMASFTPGERDALDREAGRALPRPIFLSVGRVAPEKNLEALLHLKLPGSVVVVGDGPALPSLRARYPHALWLGARRHDALAPLYRAADVFVFPSRTDTFGLVMLEAMACGTPVAAFPVTGPIDVVEPGRTGVLDDDLGAACRSALLLPRDAVREAVLQRSWHAVAQTLLEALVPLRLDGLGEGGVLVEAGR